MKLHFVVLLLLSSGTLFAQSKNTVVIKGTVTGDLKGYHKIQLFTRTDTDSTEIKDGKYTFSFPFNGPVMKVLYAEYTQKMRMMYRPFGILFAQPGTYYVTSDITDLYGTSKIEGPEDAVRFRKFELEQDKASIKMNYELQRLYGNSWYMIDEKNPVYEAMEYNKDSLNQKYVVPGIEKFIREKPDSYASAFVLQRAVSQIGNLKTKEYLYSLLSDKIKKSEAGKDVADHIQGIKSSSIGSTVSNFILPDPDGKDVNLADMKGKYVLIDFWASWCGPCRKSFPYMRDFYKSDKFEIYSISIDEDKPSWLKAVKEENNPWPQSWDDKNIAKSGFAVTAIPSTFLIDPNGKIIAKEVGFDTNGESQIEKIIKDLAENKKPDTDNKKVIPAMRMN